MCSKTILRLILATPLFAAMPAFAASSDFYAVGAIGRSTLDASGGSIDAVNLNSGFTSSVTSTSSGATAGKLQLGYNLGKTFSLEGGYDYLGKINFNSNATSAAGSSSIGGSKEAWLLNLDLVARAPLNEQFSIIGRIGGYYWKTKSGMPNATSLGTSTVNDTGWDVKAGIGLQYDVNQRMGLRGEFERFNGVGSGSSSGDSKVNQLTVGAVLKF